MYTGTVAPATNESTVSSYRKTLPFTEPQPTRPSQAPNLFTRLPLSVVPVLPATGMLPVTVYLAPFPASSPFRTLSSLMPRSPFETAVHDGDATAVKRMIQAGIGDCNTIDGASGLTALMLAAQRGHEDVVLLLCKGASAEDIHRPGPDGVSPLLLAAAASHTDAMDVLLHKAATQEHKDEALAWAAVHGQVASIALLLAHGARAAQPDAMGATPLHGAAQRGHAAAIDLLLKAGAHPDAVDGGGNSALTLAVHRGHTESVRRLLTFMAAASGQTGHSALMCAAASGHADAVALLLAAGDDPHAATPAGDTALLLAAAQGQAATVKLLARKSNVQHANQHGDTALILAARGGHFDIAQRLLVKGAQAATCNLRQESALMAAGKAGHVRLVQLLTLMDIPATANSFPASSAPAIPDSTLMHAADMGDLTKAQALLDAGADVNQADDGGWTPLFNAACQGHAAILRLLLSRGAAIDHKNRNGETALMLAAGAGQFSAAQALLDAGADAGIRNHEGKTAARMAMDIGHELLAMAMDSVVARAGATSTAGTTNASSSRSSTSIQLDDTGFPAPGAKAAMQTPPYIARPACWQEAVERNDIEGLKELLSSEQRQLRTPKSKGVSLPTPFQFAAGEGYTAAVISLLAAGIHPDTAAPFSGMTALIRSASAGHTVIVQALLHAGANVDQTDKFGQTALIFAAENGRTSTVRALLQAGANVKHKSNSGRTALSAARAGKHQEVVKLLRDYGAGS